LTKKAYTKEEKMERKERVMKKFLVWIIILLLVIGIVFACFLFYASASSNGKNTGDLKEKVTEEISYMDSNLILLLNSLNHISYENYRVQTEEMESSEQGNSQSSESDSSNSQGQSGSQESGSSEENQGNGSTQKQSKITANNILNSDRNEVDWNKMKQIAENVYSSWAVVELDLHALNIKPEEILQLSSDLKSSVMQIEKEDKTNALITLANTYMTLTRVINEYETSSMKKQVGYTKANIINAYAILETNRWEDCATFLKEAEGYLNQVMNDVTVGENQQVKISKAYVLLKEMQESVQLRDTSLFYINYKNAMQTLESIG